MPAIPIIGAVAGAAGGMSQIDQGNQAAGMNQAQFNFNKKMTEDELLRKITSANKFWEEFNSAAAPKYKTELSRASAELSPLYDQQSKEAIRSLGNSQMARGFYGQLPGDVQTQDAMVKLDTAKNQAITGQANQMFQNALSRRAAEKQAGINAFGTYGQVTNPESMADYEAKQSHLMPTTNDRWDNLLFDPMHLVLNK